MSKDSDLEGRRNELNVLYNEEASTLMGFIGFRRPSSPLDTDERYFEKYTYPFVVGSPATTRQGPMDVFGSVIFLLEEIYRLCAEFKVTNKNWWESRESEADATVIGASDRLYHSHLMDFSILLAVRARNVFHLFPKLKERRVELFSYSKSKVGEILLTDTFNLLIHSWYYHTDGEYFNDVLSDRPPKAARLSKRLMGRRVPFQGFVDEVTQAISDVTLKDLTGVLLQKLEGLSADSSEQDIVFAHQNVFSLSELLRLKLQDPDFEMLSQLVADELKTPQSEFRHGPFSILFEPEIWERRMLIRVKYMSRMETGSDVSEEPQELNFKLGYRTLFEVIDEAFGEMRLVTDFIHPVRG